MINHMPSFTAAALLVANLATLPNTASAAPFSGALAIKEAVPSGVEAVRWGGWGGGGWRGGGWRGGGWGWRGPGWGWGGPGWGWGVGAGFVGGAIVGAGVACWRWAPTAWGWTRVWVC